MEEPDQQYLSQLCRNCPQSPEEEFVDHSENFSISGICESYLKGGVGVLDSVMEESTLENLQVVNTSLLISVIESLVIIAMSGFPIISFILHHNALTHLPN